VNQGHDVTTPEEAVAALSVHPLRNTVVSIVDFDLERLKVLEGVMAASPVAGSSQIRHAVYPETGGVLVYRHSKVTEPATIPQAYIDRAVEPARVVVGAVTGVKWAGPAHPDVVAVTRDWTAKAKTEPKPAEGAPIVTNTLPFTVVRPSAWHNELLQCNACKRLFVHVRGYTVHVCAGPARAPQGAVSRACAAAVAASGVQELHRLAVVAQHEVAAVTKLSPGWARAAPRDVETLDEVAMVLLADLFRAGESSGKTKCSPARAVQILKEARGPGGEVQFDEETLPSEKRAKRLFSSLSQKKRAEARA